MYGYYGATSYDSGYGGAGNFFSNVSNPRKNYASEKISNSNNRLSQAGNQSSTLQYEKTATVSSKTSHFTEDEARIRQTTDRFRRWFFE